MLKNIAYVVMTSGLLLTSVTASAMPETDSPFPKDNSTDYSINIAMPNTETDSPFPKDNSTDALPAQPVILAEGDDGKSPFPPDNSTDALPAQPVILA